MQLLWRCIVTYQMNPWRNSGHHIAVSSVQNFMWTAEHEKRGSSAKCVPVRAMKTALEGEWVSSFLNGTSAHYRPFSAINGGGETSRGFFCDFCYQNSINLSSNDSCAHCCSIHWTWCLVLRAKQCRKCEICMQYKTADCAFKHLRIC